MARKLYNNSLLKNLVRNFSNNFTLILHQLIHKEKLEVVTGNVRWVNFEVRCRKGHQCRTFTPR